VHPVLIVFPIGLFGMAFLFDLVGLGSRGTLWPAIAYWNVGAGLVTALIAALFGILDYAAIPASTRASRVGLVHGLMQTFALGLFAVSFVIRSLNRSPTMQLWAVVASSVGLCSLLGAGWLGALLVGHLGTRETDPLALEESPPIG
jgi:uncharacterized membrane protein